MACIKVPRSVCGSNDDIKAESTRNIIQVYTDWANHYLERGGYKRRVLNLQTDLCDGVLLADLVEAVTNQKVVDINRKPKNIQQMIDNVSLCIGALRILGADVGAVIPGELASGSTLRPILALLFALSRHKQRTKQLQDMPKLPSPYNKQTAVNGSGTSIPLPATVTATRRCPPDKIRPVPSTTHQAQLGVVKHGNSDRGSASSSRSTSPSQQQPPHASLSLIPQPKSQNNNRQQPSVPTPGVRLSAPSRPVSLRTPPASPYSSSTTTAPTVVQSKNSVLEKFKLFNIKEKNPERTKKGSSGVSKRTSSSSGFSSARSEHSDSSVSLCEPVKSQTEATKTKALKSKQQTKLSKQVSPKALRKEQAKSLNKIARSKGTEKMVYVPPVEDAKCSTKPVNVCSKLGIENKSNLEILKPPGTVHKINVPLPSSKQTLAACANQETRAVNADVRCTTKLKTELPENVPDSRAKLQALQTPSISSNKDILKQKNMVPNSNGLIVKPSNPKSDHELSSITNQNNHIKNIQRKNVALESLEVENSDVQVYLSSQQEQPATVLNQVSDEHSKQSINPGLLVETNHNVPNSSNNANLSDANKQNASCGPSQGSNVLTNTMFSSIPKPTALVKGTSKLAKESAIPSVMTPTKMNNECLYRKRDSATVALVSPMPSIPDLMTVSSNNQNDHSTFNKPSSHHCDDTKIAVSRKADDNYEHIGNAPSENMTCGGSTADDEAEMSIKPMEPILRGYTSNSRGLQTLPNRTSGRQYTILHSSSHHHVNHDYADVDIASGYLSDGEILRGGVNTDNRALSDLCDGYMSESGASFYTRRINNYSNDHDRYVGGSRREVSGIKEVVSSSRRISRRPPTNVRADEGCISVGSNQQSDLLGSCSGGSDALADLTAEDLASIPAINCATNHNSNSSHHKRLPAGGSIVVGGGTGSATPQGVQQNNNLVYRVVSSKHPNHHQHVKKSDSSQQTENSAFKQQQQQSSNCSSNISNSQQWKKYIEAGAVRDRDREKEATPPSPCPSRKSQDKHRKQTMAEYTNGEKSQKVSSGTSTSGSKVRGVPQSFGYVKRHSAGTSAASNGIQNGNKEAARTAQVSAVPRTKVKVSGGTQTTADLQSNSGSNQHHYKSFSLTGASATQLSQCVRDRLMGSQSLPKAGSPDYSAYFASSGHHRERGNNSSPSIPSFSPRALKPSDGSLSDTCSNYAAPDIQGYYTNSPYSSSWMRHSNTYTPSGRSTGMGLCEADSVESLGSHRSSLTHARLLMHQRDSTGSPAPPRLNRSNSIRSTKSEKMYPSMLARGSGTSSTVGEEVGIGIPVGVEPYYSVPVGSAGCSGQHWSQPTSPTPTHTPRQPPNLYQHMHKDDEIHGSSVSLVSTASSLYSSAEEKQAHEVRKLRRELLDAQEKVHSLTSQLSTNAHVVSAFEQSLSNMTQRLQQLTATAEKKDSELQELRETIERLRKQSAEASLNNGPVSNSRRHTLGDSESGTTGCTGNTGNSNHQISSMARQLSADSVTSLNSLSSACSASSHQKKKGWLRSSFSKAFSRSRKNRHGSVSDAEDCKETTVGEASAPNSPRLPTATKHDNSTTSQTQSNTKNKEVMAADHENTLSGSKSSSALYNKEDENVDELKKQLREKDLVLTDIRLEALSSAHQLESLKDTVIKMRNEMLNLKQNNERLQRLVTSKSLTSSQSSLPSDPERRFSMTEVATSVAAMANGDSTSNADQLEDLSVPEHSVVSSGTSNVSDTVIEQDTDGKRINVAIYLGSEKTFNCNSFYNPTEPGTSGEPVHCIIANVCISNKTTWDTLDSIVRRCFKDYVSRIDPVTNLGLGVECVASYHLGEASRCTTDSQHPELLPCGYLVGHVKTIYLVLSGYSWLAVDTLIPRSIVQRLVSLLTEHRRVILCGPSGTGKSYLAGKLAHALVDTDAEVKDVAAVATFNVDHKSSKELRQYLAHIAERCDSNAADELPKVIILENLQHATSLGELFSGLLGTRHSSCPAIIGTMSQATCSTTNLQLHHNFRWVLCANHMEPVKGFLGRYLRRKLLEHELREGTGTRNAEMAAVVEWLSRVWLHLNKFLETHSSSDVTIGPRLFLPCPMEVAGSQVWFTDLWNYSIIPYLVEAVREGFTLYGRRINSGTGNSNENVWEDPAQFIVSSYPWISTHAVHGGSDALLRLRPEDVGFDVVNSSHVSGVGSSSVKSLGSTHGDSEGDPLLNMLKRLQEAANYSSPHSNDTDSVTSMESNIMRHSEDLSLNSSSKGVESAL